MTKCLDRVQVEQSCYFVTCPAVFWLAIRLCTWIGLVRLFFPSTLARYRQIEFNSLVGLLPRTRISFIFFSPGNLSANDPTVWKRRRNEKSMQDWKAYENDATLDPCLLHWCMAVWLPLASWIFSSAYANHEVNIFGKKKWLPPPERHPAPMEYATTSNWQGSGCFFPAKLTYSATPFCRWRAAMKRVVKYANFLWRSPSREKWFI